MKRINELQIPDAFQYNYESEQVNKFTDTQ